MRATNRTFTGDDGVIPGVVGRAVRADQTRNGVDIFSERTCLGKPKHQAFQAVTRRFSVGFDHHPPISQRQGGTMADSVPNGRTVPIA